MVLQISKNSTMAYYGFISYDLLQNNRINIYTLVANIYFKNQQINSQQPL